MSLCVKPASLIHVFDQFFFEKKTSFREMCKIHIFVSDGKRQQTQMVGDVPFFFLNRMTYLTFGTFHY